MTPEELNDFFDTQAQIKRNLAAHSFNPHKYEQEAATILELKKAFNDIPRDSETSTQEPQVEPGKTGEGNGRDECNCGKY